MGAERILCVAGSPRRGGNSDKLLDALVVGIQSAGGTPDVLVASESGVGPCRGCNSCSKTGACVVEDSMQSIYGRIDAASAIVVASPVYFASVPAVLKTLYDRCQPYWARAHVLGEPRPPRRPGAFLLVRGGGDPFGFDGAEATTRSVYAVLGIDIVGVVEVDDVDELGAIEGRIDALEAARDLGERVVQEVRATSV